MLKKAGTLLTMAVVFFVLLAVGLAGCGDEGEIFLEAGSQGRPGNSTVYDLEPGTMYLVRNGITWHIVQTDGGNWFYRLFYLSVWFDFYLEA